MTPTGVGSRDLHRIWTTDNPHDHAIGDPPVPERYGRPVCVGLVRSPGVAALGDNLWPATRRDLGGRTAQPSVVPDTQFIDPTPVFNTWH